MSEAIVNAPIIVVAGAGASAHLGYLTGRELLKKLTTNASGVGFLSGQSIDVTRVFERLTEAPPGPHGQWLWNALQKSYGRRCDFEDMYDKLAAIKRLDSMPFGLRGIENSPFAGEPSGTLEACADALGRMLIQTIVEEFTKQPKRVDAPGESIAGCWGPFLESLYPWKNGVIPVFTTNYDVSFEWLRPELKNDYAIHVEDAFEGDLPGGAHSWRRERLHKGPPNDANRYVWIFRLHGSVAWESTESFSLWRTWSYDDPPAWLRFDRERQPAPDRSPWERRMVVPSKEKRPFQDPFWTEYRYFLRCLDNARVVIFLGYSFADDHIRAAVGEATRRNEQLNLIVISDVAEEEWFFEPVLEFMPGERVTFIGELFTAKGLEKLCRRCKEALQGFGEVPTRGGYIEPRT